METILYPTKEAIDYLIEKLKLPKYDKFSQDWEYESADVNRIEEFIRFYETENLSAVEKFTLMIILISSCNDAIGQGGFSLDLWKRIEAILIRDVTIHKSTIQDWSCEEEPLEECYSITPFIRKVIKEGSLML